MTQHDPCRLNVSPICQVCCIIVHHCTWPFVLYAGRHLTASPTCIQILYMSVFEIKNKACVFVGEPRGKPCTSAEFLNNCTVDEMWRNKGRRLMNGAHALSRQISHEFFSVAGFVCYTHIQMALRAPSSQQKQLCQTGLHNAAQQEHSLQIKSSRQPPLPLFVIDW